MKIALISCVKNEIDILPYWWEYYKGLADLTVVTDNNSTDGTREFLESHAGDKKVTIRHEPSNKFTKDLWLTEMMNIALDNGCGNTTPVVKGHPGNFLFLSILIGGFGPAVKSESLVHSLMSLVHIFFQ